MRWIEIAMDVDGEAAEAVADVLQRYGHQGVAIEQAGFYIETWEDEVPPAKTLIVRAYIPDDERAPDSKAQLEEALFQLGKLYPMPKPRYTVIDEEDWAEAWKVHYHPLRIGRHIFIRPLWIDDFGQPGDVVISLDPGMAFGTGTHPSTQLVLEAAEDLIEAHESRQTLQVLDLGCGSGILAIGAAKLGAAHVLALDTDPIAVTSTRSNADANGITDALITAQDGSLDTLLASGEQFDLALVNILAKVIITMCGQGLGKVVKTGGVAVFGGIIETQADEVETALRAAGLMPYKRRLSADWVVIEAKRELTAPESTGTITNRADALALVNQWTTAPHLLRHMLAVEAGLRAYAAKFGEDVEQWGLTGLLHDFDYEKLGAEGHVTQGVPILREKGVAEPVLHAIQAHYESATGVKPETRLDNTLMAVDELTGFITAVTLVRPSKRIADVELKSVKKKWKEKEFAAPVSRQEIEHYAAAIGVPLDEHIQLVLDAMKANAEALGL